MKLSDYRKELQNNPEYLEARKKLRASLVLGNNILRLRLAKGWSQAELAERVGTQQANISRIESGLGNPTFGFLEKLAEALETELEINFVIVSATTSLIKLHNEIVETAFADNEKNAEPIPAPVRLHPNPCIGSNSKSATSPLSLEVIL
jgi:transcriptional regulator with XRE-family HTH domain